MLDPSRLFVSNMNAKTSWKVLKDHFAQAGEVNFVDIYRYTNKSRYIQDNLLGTSKVRERPLLLQTRRPTAD